MQLFVYKIHKLYFYSSYRCPFCCFIRHLSPVYRVYCIRLLFISVPSRKSWSSGCPTASWQPHLLRSSWWITTGGMSLKENLPVWGHVHHLLNFSMSCIWEEKILNPRYELHIGPDAPLWYHHVLGRLGTCLTLRDFPSISAKWSTFDEPIELTAETGIKICLKSGDSLTRDQGIP